MIWFNIIVVGWQEDYSILDEKVVVLGQCNIFLISVMLDIIVFYQLIGKVNVEV